MTSTRYLLGVCCVASGLHATIFETFPFPLSAFAFSRPFTRFYVGAAHAISKNDHAIAVASKVDTSFTGITPARVTLNNKADQPNPLHGAAIDHLTLLDRRPVAVARQLPSTLFLIEDRTNPTAVFQSPPLNNALGKPAVSLLALTTIAAELQDSLAAGSDSAAIAAVPNQAGGFDGNGSGIALAYYRPVVKGKETFFAWDIVNAVSGTSSFTQEGLEGLQGNIAAPIQKNTPQLMIEAPVGKISPLVDLHFDRDLGRLYIATQVVGAQGQNAGARGIVVGSIFNGKVQFHTIAPDSVFDGQDQIVGKRGALAQTTIYKVRTLQTRTYLRYLLVVGGNGDDPLLDQKVFALPLVDNLQKPDRHGTLANIRNNPVTLFSAQSPHRFVGRVYATAAEAPEDVYTMTSSAAQVGGDVVLPGPITDIHSAGETVFVSCDERRATNKEALAAGIFYSQPVFDALSRIVGWTGWQRAFGSRPIKGFGYDPTSLQFWELPLTNTAEVGRSQWTDGTGILDAFITQYFSQTKGGVQGLFDMPYTTKGFSTAFGTRLSVQCFTGYQTVLLTQTGKEQQGLFMPYLYPGDTFVSHDGTLQGFSGSASNIVMSGGALDLLGPITSAAVVTNGITGWFVVGGVGGIAVLTDAQGRGWDALKGLASGFKGLTSQLSWKIISTTPYIRRLAVEGEHLFALSQTKLERFDNLEEALMSNTLQSVVLAELSEDQIKHDDSYSDLHIQGPLALLATNVGLVRSANNMDVRSETMISWTDVSLPESVGSLVRSGPVTRFFAYSSTDQMTDNVYVLNAYVGLDQALIYRLVLTDSGHVTDSSVTLFPDYILKDTQSFFTNIGEYHNYVVTDGSFIALSGSAFRRNLPRIELLSPTIKGGESARMRFPLLSLPEQAQTVGRMVRSSASGSWTVSGDFGIRVQI